CNAVTFAQKHEVRQVYVRSTSRVYEIYYASELQSSDEYLCTVRCGIAVRGEEVLHAIDVEETVSAHQKGSTKELAEERHKNGSNLITSEDDWVEVKALNTQLVNGNSSPLSNSDTSERRISQPQDFYEATADVADANPCTSITLRLLSLQNKGCICIDEVYVFADPVDAADLDSKVSPMESSSGNSLMAMVMPTFLQLSEMNGFGLALDKCDRERINEQKSEKNEAKPPDPIDAGKDIQQERKSGSVYKQGVQLQEQVIPTAKPVELEIPPQVSDKESKPDISHNHFEGVLHQLVSRVTRMEDLFLRFEDCMLKPIRSIDERLQRVEQQLEVLTKKTQNSGLLSCNRISAPEFSCSESETSSLYNSGADLSYLGLLSCNRISAPEFSCSESETSSLYNSGADLSYAACDANKKDSLPAVSSAQSDVPPVLLNASRSHPSLVVTAPEFSNCDDDEEDDAVKSDDEEKDDAAEPVTESPKEKQKLGLSIDDALASALAGLLTSASKFSKAIAIKAPEFSNEEGNNSDKATSPKVHSEILKGPLTGFGETDGTELPRSSWSSSPNISSSESNKSVLRSGNNNNCVRTIEGVNGHLQHSEGGEGDSPGNCIDLTVPARHDVERTDPFKIINDMENGQIDSGTSSISEPEKTDGLEQFSENQAGDVSDTTKEGAIKNELIASREVADEGSNLDIVQNVVELSHSTSKVDFETPILEVTFNSQGNMNTKSPLEALLAGTSDLHIDANPVEENSNNDSEVSDKYSLIPVEDWGEMSSATDNHISLDMDYCSLTISPLNADDALDFI
ncbi:uncharacterized protein LOC105628714, partial [Jatropha curcas]|uniref:uncharacterized protein LOC105628714 n=1 Tax=Jatropha curcas TaxID=180498 RepID=UPI001895FDE0